MVRKSPDVVEATCGSIYWPWRTPIHAHSEGSLGVVAQQNRRAVFLHEQWSGQSRAVFLHEQWSGQSRNYDVEAIRRLRGEFEDARAGRQGPLGSYRPGVARRGLDGLAFAFGQQVIGGASIRKAVFGVIPRRFAEAYQELSTRLDVQFHRVGVY